MDAPRYTFENKAGDYSTQVSGGPATTNPDLINARLGVLRPQTYAARDRDGSLSGRAKGWEIAIFARNLLNADYIQNLTIQAGNSGLVLGTPSDPRTVGVTFRLRR